MSGSEHQPADFSTPGEVTGNDRKAGTFAAWRTELFFTIPIVGLVFCLFYTWYAVLDRYFIFLYFHDMGPRFDTSPFGAITASRYWMAGLVAAGAVMIPYVALNCVLGRLFRSFSAPVWWRLWLLCAVPLLIAIPLLVMTVNDPVLPLANAVQVIAATLIGLALALAPGKVAAEKPFTLTWLAVDGTALAFLLLFLTYIERISTRPAPGSIASFIALAVIGLGMLVVMTAFYGWRRIQAPDGVTWFVSGLIIAYLFLPLCHYLFAGGGEGSSHFAYITDSANFFADNALIQIAAWGIVLVLALGMTWLRQRLLLRRTI